MRLLEGSGGLIVYRPCEQKEYVFSQQQRGSPIGCKAIRHSEEWKVVWEGAE